MITKNGLSIVEYAKGDIAGSKKCYYGLNVSPSASLEPIDQLDGFLVAKYLQKSFGAEGRFYPYIAGAYGMLNSRSPKEARKKAENLAVCDRRKKDLLGNVMGRMEIEGDVLTTCDMWDTDDYWEIFYRLVCSGIMEGIPDRYRRSGIEIRDFPKEFLGRMENVVGNRCDYLYSGSLYVPAEVAEAVWLKEMFGVRWKIGPPSEEIYDNFIKKEGIGIIRTAQPLAEENGAVREVVPYIGKSTQPGRILFSDTTESLAGKCRPENPSFEFVMMLAGIYETLLDAPAREPVERIYRMVSLGKDSDR